MSEVKHGVGLPSAKTSFKPSSKGKNTTLPLEKTALEAGEERYGLDPDIDPEKANLNIFISQYGYTKGQEVIDHCKKRMGEISQATGKKVREDAIPMIATILKPNASVIMPLDNSERKVLLDNIVEEALVNIGCKALGLKNRKELGDNVSRDDALSKGRELAIMIAYHFDERVPHVHILWEPIEMRDGIPHYNAKGIHDKVFLGNLNREIPQALIDMGYKFDKSFDFWDADEALRLERLHEIAEGKVKSGQSSHEFKKSKLEEAQRELEHMQELAAEPLVEVLVEEKGLIKKETVLTEPEKLDEVLEQNRALKVSLQVKDKELASVKEHEKYQEDELEELRPYKSIVKRIVEQVVSNPFFNMTFLKLILQEMPLFTRLQQEHEKRQRQKQKLPEKKPMLSQSHDWKQER